MSRTYAVKNLSIPTGILEALEAKKEKEGRLGSLTAYASEILSRYVKGTIVSEELLRAKIESELQTKFLDGLQGRDTQAAAIKVRAHRPPKDDRGSSEKVA